MRTARNPDAARLGSISKTLRPELAGLGIEQVPIVSIRAAAHGELHSFRPLGAHDVESDHAGIAIDKFVLDAIARLQTVPQNEQLRVCRLAGTPDVAVGQRDFRRFWRLGHDRVRRRQEVIRRDAEAPTRAS